MTPATHYRTRAAQLRTRAKAEDSRQLRAEWDCLWQRYIIPAEQADRNAQTDVSYESILRNDFGDFGGELA